MLGNQDYRHAPIICNTYCLSRQQWLRERASVLGLYVHCHIKIIGLKISSYNFACNCRNVHNVKVSVHIANSIRPLSLLLPFGYERRNAAVAGFTRVTPVLQVTEILRGGGGSNSSPSVINWFGGEKGKKSHLSIENKLLIYKAVIKPIWSCCGGCASKSNVVIMQRSQSKILRAIANAPRYVTNRTLHADFNIPYVSDVTHERISKHHNKLEAHPSPLLEPLLQPVNTRRLKRCRPLDLQGI
jgi:hypothetical protein